MREAIIITLIGLFEAIVLFICHYIAFNNGLRLGMQTAKGIVPPKIDLVAAVKETVVKPPELPNEIMKGYANMMNFTGEPPKEEK